MVPVDPVKNSKPVIVFSFPDCMGGVASFNRNIINYSSLKNFFHTKVILIRSREDKRQDYQDTISADEVCRFNYSDFENQYYVCKRLNELIGEEEGCIITDNGLTLNAVAGTNNPKKVLFLVHDYFYIDTALRFEPMIDAAIAHSSFFKDILYAALPDQYSRKTYFIPYGVEQPQMQPEKKNQGINLVFLGRLVESKGVLLLKAIDSLLVKKGIVANWTIIGSGPLEKEIRQQWIHSANIDFENPVTTAEVYAILGKQDILVLPTSFEGTPVSILESISNSVVPVVSDLPGGIRDIVTDEIGYKCEPGNLSQFAGAIEELSKDTAKLRHMQSNGNMLAKKKYNIVEASNAYFEFFIKQFKTNNPKKSFDPLFSRLDRKKYPPRLVYFIRKFRSD